MMSEQTNPPQHFNLEELEELREVVTVLLTVMEAEMSTDKVNPKPEHLRLKTILENCTT